MEGFPEFPGNENGLPPEEVRLQELHVEPWPDRRRIRVHIQMTPFAQRPNLELRLLDAQAEEITSLQLIEALTPRFVVTMHLRRLDPNGKYSLSARLYYPDLDPAHQLTHDFEVLPPDEAPEA